MDTLEKTDAASNFVAQRDYQWQNVHIYLFSLL